MQHHTTHWSEEELSFQRWRLQRRRLGPPSRVQPTHFNTGVVSLFICSTSFSSSLIGTIQQPSAFYLPIHPHIHTPTGDCCNARHCVSPKGAIGVHCLAQAHFNKQLEPGFKPPTLQFSVHSPLCDTAAHAVCYCQCYSDYHHYCLQGGKKYF